MRLLGVSSGRPTFNAERATSRCRLNPVRNLTTRLVLLLVLALMVITGIFDYVRLAEERGLRAVTG